MDFETLHGYSDDGYDLLQTNISDFKYASYPEIKLQKEIYHDTDKYKYTIGSGAKEVIKVIQHNN